MPSPLAHAVHRLAHGGDLSSEETAEAFGVVMRGEATPAAIAALLMGLRMKGETPAEIAGAAQALRSAMIPVRLSADPPAIDTCGTGGGTVGTFNVSTAAAFVAVGAGARVAKHGNRSYTSKCGSADVLEALGADVTLTADAAAALFEQTGLVFLFAPTYHPAMRHAGPTRKELGVPTVMNLLGPLCNPAGVRRQVIGVADPVRAPRVAEALRRLGVEHALVVHADVGMDEISPAGTTRVWEVRGDVVTTWTVDPAAHGLSHDRLEDLAGGLPEENARRIEALLGGKPDPGARAAVLLNAAAAIYVAGLETSYAASVERAVTALEDGRAGEVLKRLRRSGG